MDSPIVLTVLLTYNHQTHTHSNLTSKQIYTHSNLTSKQINLLISWKPTKLRDIKGSKNAFSQVTPKQILIPDTHKNGPFPSNKIKKKKKKKKEEKSNSREKENELQAGWSSTCGVSKAAIVVQVVPHVVTRAFGIKRSVVTHFHPLLQTNQPEDPRS